MTVSPPAGADRAAGDRSAPPGDVDASHRRDAGRPAGQGGERAGGVHRSLRLLVAGLAALAPIGAPPEDALERDLALLGLPWGSAQLRTAALGAAALGTAAALLAVLLGAPLLGASAALTGGLLGAALVGGVRWRGTLARSRALGAAPTLVGLAALRGRVDPAPEATAAFAARHATGTLADALERSVRATRGRPGAGWQRLADRWGGRSPGLERAAALLLTASSAEPSRRGALFDRALDAVLDGTRDRAAGFAAGLRGPTSGLYAFGVVLPLALVAVLPAVAGTGLPIVVPVVVAYDVVLPVTTAIAAAWLLARRPVAFPPVAVDADHPDVPDRGPRTAAVGLLGAGLGWLLVPLVAPAWCRWLAGPGLAAGGALVAWWRPVRAVRREVRAVEAAVPDAVTLVAGDLERGRSPEAAVAEAGERLDGPAGECFAAAAANCRRLGVDVRAAFTGPHGAMRRLPSPRLHAVAALVALAGAQGRHGGAVLSDLAGHVEALDDVERSSRRALAPIVGTLRSTAWCFAPLIGGATVGMATGIADAPGTEAAGFAAVPAAPLGLAVGVYVATLAAILAALAVGLERGLDPALVGYEVGIALCASSVIYPLSVVATGLLV